MWSVLHLGFKASTFMPISLSTFRAEALNPVFDVSTTSELTLQVGDASISGRHVIIKIKLITYFTSESHKRN